MSSSCRPLGLNQWRHNERLCNPAAGWGEPLCAIGSRTMANGQVDKNVQVSRDRPWQPMPNFPDLAGLNAWLERRCVDLWRDIPQGAQPGTIAGVQAEEQTALMPLPPAFDGFVEQSKRVSPTCLVSFDRNRYSVPCCGRTRPHQGPRSLSTLREPLLQPEDLPRTDRGGRRGQTPMRA